MRTDIRIYKTEKSLYNDKNENWFSMSFRGEYVFRIKKFMPESRGNKERKWPKGLDGTVHFWCVVCG